MADLLTPLNFIEKIKEMTGPERNRIKKEDLIRLIVDAPTTNLVIEEKFGQLTASINAIQTQAHNNAVEITNVKRQNDEQQHEIVTLKQSRDDLVNELNAVKKQCAEQEVHLNNIEQYLRANNLEIVGYPDVPITADYEETLVNLINQLPGLSTGDKRIPKEDIDICHPVQSERRDHKNVGLVRFVSRKTKLQILEFSSSAKQHP